MTAEGLFAFAVIAYCFLRKEAKECEKRDSWIPVAVQPDPMTELESAKRAVEEQLAVINKTKDVETGIRCFAVIRSTLNRLADLKPLVIRLGVTVGDKEICKELQVASAGTGDILTEMEKQWMRGFFKEKADTLLKQSEDTRDAVLKEELLREAARGLSRPSSAA